MGCCCLYCIQHLQVLHLGEHPCNVQPTVKLAGIVGVRLGSIKAHFHALLNLLSHYSIFVEAQPPLLHIHHQVQLHHKHLTVVHD